MDNYDPKQVVLTFKGVLITGFLEGTFITVERNEDSFEKTVGADGNVTRVRKNDRSGTITVVLQAESPSNDVLSASMLLDEQSGLGYGPVQVKNINSTDLHTAAEAWVRKPASAEYSDGASGREWVLECANLTMLVGSAIV